MKTYIALAAIILSIAGVSSARAATLDITLNSTNGIASSNPNGAPISSNITFNQAISSSQLVTTGLVSLETSSFSDEYTMPSGTLNGGNYLAVIATPGGPVGPGAPGVATFSLATGDNTFSFTWGTIDTYNTLTLTDSLGHTYVITGTQILGDILNSKSGTTQSDVSFLDPFANIVTAQFTTTTNAFEVANFEQSKTSAPLPDALPLFGMGIVALGLLALRRKAAVKN
jgi:hypothetical protein